MANERRVFTYILTLLPNVADAQDVLQETSIVLWRKFAEYRPGSDFTAWAFRVAQNMVRNYRAKQRRCRVKFDERLLAAVAGDVESMREELDFARSATVDCVDELPPADRDLLRRRYETGATIKSVAEAVGRSVGRHVQGDAADSRHAARLRRAQDQVRGDACPQVLRERKGIVPRSLGKGDNEHEVS